MLQIGAYQPRPHLQSGYFRVKSVKMGHSSHPILPHFVTFPVCSHKTEPNVNILKIGVIEDIFSLILVKS